MRLHVELRNLWTAVQLRPDGLKIKGAHHQSLKRTGRTADKNMLGGYFWRKL